MRSFAHRLALAGTASLAAILSALPVSAQGTEPVFRAVGIPTIPSGVVCADVKTRLIETAAGANAAAADNAQTASRTLAELQATQARLRGTGTVAVDRAAGERDRRLDEWRRAEAVFAAAVRLEERDCRPPETLAQAAPERIPGAPLVVDPGAARDGATVQAPPAEDGTSLARPNPEAPGATIVRPAPDAPGATIVAPAAPPPAPAVVTAPPAAPAPTTVSSGQPGVSLAAFVSAPARCRAGQSCEITVEIENRGSEPFPSPILASLALGFDGGTIGSVTPDVWSCGRGGDALSCAISGVSLQPDTRTRMTIDWRLPERVRRPNATVCVRLIWPAASNGGVLRAEQVSAVQFALQRAGFDPGGITGRIGPRTIDAIRGLRERVGIQGGGQITPDLLANLFGRTGALTGDDDPANDTACATVAFDDRQGLPIIGPATGAGAGAAVVPPPVVQPPRQDPRVARPAPRPDAAQPQGDVARGDPAPRAPAGRVAPAPTARPDPQGREPRVVIAPAIPPGDFGPRVAPSGRVLPPSEQRPRVERRPPPPRVVSPQGHPGERVRVVRPVRPQVHDDDDVIVVYRRPGTVFVQPGPVYREPPVVHGRPRYVYREWGWGQPPRVYMQPW